MKKKITASVLMMLLLIGLLPNLVVAAHNLQEAQQKAEALKSLHLFRGVSEHDFALQRAPNRIETLVMFVRLIGGENAALSGYWQHPFVDVPQWANAYVGYAYEKGYANGVSAKVFGAQDSAGCAMYLTLLLRALGYSDAPGGDFSWKDPYTLSRSIGLLSENVDTNQFLRADVALISWNALFLPMNGGNKALADLLIMSGAFTQEQFEQATLSAKKGNQSNTAVINGVKVANYICYADSFGSEYSPEYRPYITLNSNMSCVVCVNMGEGMATGTGTWRAEVLDTGEIAVFITIATASWCDSYHYALIYHNDSLIMSDNSIGITSVESAFKLAK